MATGRAKCRACVADVQAGRLRGQPALPGQGWRSRTGQAVTVSLPLVVTQLRLQ